MMNKLLAKKTYHSHNTQVGEHFDQIALDSQMWKQKNNYYHKTLKAYVASVVRPGSSVLDVGCGLGHLLASTKPSRGVGVDLSKAFIHKAQQQYPEHEFICTSLEEFQSDEKFDYIVLVDVVDHVYDILEILEAVSRHCHSTTKVILTTINPWWDPVLILAEKLKLKMPEGPHNFVEKSNILKFVELLNFSVSYSGFMLLMPKYIPLISFLLNSIGTRIWGLNKLSWVQSIVLQATPENETDLGYGVSVVVPCHNEEGNIQEAVRRIPQMGTGTEIIVVNDGSTDETSQRVKALQKEYNNLKLIDYPDNQGKGYAVQQGFEAASHDVLMILDADMTVPPEDLPKFFGPLNKGLCQFVNGTRLIYPMEGQAMRTLNLLGNKIFGLIMTFLTNQHLTDTLCGTKAFLKKDYPYYQMGKDKWGDFDLLFGAAKMGNKIMEVPIHYKDRVAGQSKMKTFSHGMHLLGACVKGFKELVLTPRGKDSQ